MPELVVAVLIGSISEVVEEEEEGTTKFEVDDADKACSCVAWTVLCDVGLLALLALALPETFRLNDVRAWAIPNKSSPRAIVFAAEASAVSERTAPVPELMIVAVAFPQAESTGKLDVEFCAEAAFMMKSISMPERSAW